VALPQMFRCEQVNFRPALAREKKTPTPRRGKNWARESVVRSGLFARFFRRMKLQHSRCDLCRLRSLGRGILLPPLVLDHEVAYDPTPGGKPPAGQVL